MRGVRTLFASSIGQKISMAASGVLLFGFVVGHLAGNLKLYQGEVKFDAYAHFLREVGAPVFGHSQLLWIFRLGLLAAVAVHLLAALRLTRMSRAARPRRYRKSDDLGFSYASRTMRWGGVIVLLFVVYHLMHLTWGNAHHDFVAGSPYRNVVAGFSVWWVSAAYIGAMVPLGLHLYHGLWSATQTLALRSPGVRRWRRPVAGAIAALIVAGNISFPIAVLAGVID